jgi:hypothetical protein
MKKMNYEYLLSVWVLCYDRRSVDQSVLEQSTHLVLNDQIFSTVRLLRVCWYEELSVTRGRVCHLQLLLALTSAVILRSNFRGTRGHILLSHIRDFPFRHLLRLAGLRWRYSTPLWISPSIYVITYYIRISHLKAFEHRCTKLFLANWQQMSEEFAWT